MPVDSFFCPHCRAKMEKLASTCPTCQQAILPDFAHKLAWLEFISQDINHLYQTQNWTKDELQTVMQSVCTSQSRRLKATMVKQLQEAGHTIQPSTTDQADTIPQTIPADVIPQETQLSIEPTQIQSSIKLQPDITMAPTKADRDISPETYQEQLALQQKRREATPNIQEQELASQDELVSPEPKKSKLQYAIWIPLATILYFLTTFALHEGIAAFCFSSLALAWAIWQSRLWDDLDNNAAFRVLQTYNIICSAIVCILIFNMPLGYHYYNNATHNFQNQYGLLVVIFPFLLLCSFVAHFTKLRWWIYLIICVAAVLIGNDTTIGIFGFSGLLLATLVILTFVLVVRGLARLGNKSVARHAQKTPQETRAGEPVRGYARHARVPYVASKTRPVADNVTRKPKPATSAMQAIPKPTPAVQASAPITPAAEPAPATSLASASIASVAEPAPATSLASAPIAPAPEPAPATSLASAPIASVAEPAPATSPTTPMLQEIAPRISKETVRERQKKILPFIPLKARKAKPADQARPAELVTPAKPTISAKQILMTYIAHPAIRENILIFLGIFLIMAGEIFFVASQWESKSEERQQWGILALLLSSGIFFYFLARITLRFKQSTATFIFYFLALFLLPLAMLLPTSMIKSDNILEGLCATAIILGLAVWYTRTLSVLLPEIKISLVILFPILLLFNLFAPQIHAQFPWSWIILGYLALLIAIVSWRRMENKQALYLWLAISSCTVLITLGNFQSSLAQNNDIKVTLFSSYMPGFYALMPGLIALRLLQLDDKQHEKPSLSFLMILAITLAIFGVCLGPWQRLRTTEGFGEGFVLLGIATLLMLVFSRYAYWHKSIPLFLSALFVSALVYFLLPAPFKAIVLAFKEWVSGELGYSKNNPLPFSYYGITFFPYLAILCWFGTRLIKYEQARLFKALQIWFLAISIGLLCLVQLTGVKAHTGILGAADLRPLLVTLPLFGIGYLIAQRCLRLPLLIYCSIAVVSLWLYNCIPTFFLAMQGYEGMDLWNTASEAHVQMMNSHPIILVCLALFWGILSCLVRSEKRVYFCDSAICLTACAMFWLFHNQLIVPVNQQLNPLLLGILECITAILWFFAIAILRSRILWFAYILCAVLGILHISNWWAYQDMQILASANLLHSFILVGFMLALQKMSHGTFLDRVLTAISRPGISNQLSLQDWAIVPLSAISLMVMLYSGYTLTFSNFWDTPALYTLILLACASVAIVKLGSGLNVRGLYLATSVPWAMITFAIACQKPGTANIVAWLSCVILGCFAIVFMFWTWRKRIASIQLWIPAVISICLSFVGGHLQWSFSAIGLFVASLSLCWIVLRQYLEYLGFQLEPSTVSAPATSIPSAPAPSVESPAAPSTAPTAPSDASATPSTVSAPTPSDASAAPSTVSVPTPSDASAAPSTVSVPVRFELNITYQAIVLELYSIILAIVAGMLLSNLGNVSKPPTTYSICGFLVIATMLIIHTFHHPWRIFNLLAFFVSTTAVIQTAVLVYPPVTQSYQVLRNLIESKDTFTAIVVAFAIWGIILYLIHRTLYNNRTILPASWKNNFSLVTDIQWYADFMFFAVYLVASYNTIIQQSIDFLPISGLLICVLYSFMAGIDKQHHLPIYIAAFVLNQTLITIYLFSAGAPLAYRVPLVQAMVCLVFQLTAWILNYRPKLKVATQVLDRYAGITLLLVFLHLFIWRIDYSIGRNFRFVALDAVQLYTIAGFLTAFLFIVIRHTTQMKFWAYPGLLTLLLSVCISLDNYSPSWYFCIPPLSWLWYVIACTIAILIFALLALIWRSMSSALNHISIIFGLLDLALLFILYLMIYPNFRGGQEELNLTLVLSIFMLAHSIFYYLRTRQELWAVFSVLNFVLMIGYQHVIVRSTIPQEYFLLCLAGWMTVGLIAIFLLRHLSWQKTFTGGTLTFSGSAYWEISSTVYAFLIQLLMFYVLVLWLVWSRVTFALGFGALGIPLWYIKLLALHPYIWLCTLIAYLMIQTAMAKTSTHIVGHWQEHGLWFNLVLIALWFPQISQWCDAQTGFAFGGIECALVALIAAFLSTRKQQVTWLIWSICISALVTIISVLHCDLLSSVVALLVVSLVFLFLTHSTKEYWNSWRPIYWIVFGTALFILGNYVDNIPQPVLLSWGMICFIFLLMSNIIAFNIENKTFQNFFHIMPLIQDLARFMMWIVLVILCVTGYYAEITKTSAPWDIPLLAIFAIFTLCQLGKSEKFPLSHYAMLFLLPALYWFVRDKLGWFGIFAGFDIALCFIVFCLGSHIFALQFSKPSRWPQVLSNFGVIFGFGLIVLNINTARHWEVPTALGLSFMSLLLLVRQWLLQQTALGTPSTPVPATPTTSDSSAPTTSTTPTPALASTSAASATATSGGGTILGISEEAFNDFEQTMATTTSIILVFLAIVAGAWGYFNHIQGLNWWLPCLLLILSFTHYFAYLTRQESWSLWVAYSFITLAGYTAVALNFDIQKGGLFVHICYLVLTINIVLLAQYGSQATYNLGPGLVWNRNKAKEIAINFSWGLLSALLFCGVIALFAMQTQTVTVALGSEPMGFWLACLCTFATIYHVHQARPVPYHLIAFFIVCLGLGSPLGHWLSGIAWNKYAPPCVESAIVACIVWALRNRFKYLSIWIGHFLIASAIFLMPWNINMPLMFVTLFTTSLYLLLISIQKQERSLFIAYAVNMLIAIYCFIFYVIPKTGNPPPLILPLLAIVTIVLSYVWVLAQQWLSDEERFPNIQIFLPDFTHIAGFFSILSSVMILAGVVMISDSTTNRIMYQASPTAYSNHTVLTTIAFILAILMTISLSRRTNKLLFILEFQALLVGFYYFIRLRAHWLNFLDGYDAHALVVFSLTFYEIGQYYHKVEQETKSQAYCLMGYILPFVAFGYRPWNMHLAGSGLLLLTAVHYGIIYLDTLRKWVLMLCLALFNLALFQFWVSQNIIDPQFYGIPIGLTLILLGELYRSKDNETQTYTLRLIGLLLVYGSSSMQVMTQLLRNEETAPIYALVLGFLALIGIVIGIVRKNNLYLYLAGAFLICDVLGYIVQYGAKRGILGGIFLVLAGVTILSTALWFKFKKKDDTDDEKNSSSERRE